MTIQFDCPKCGSLIAFGSKHIGKRARCLSCGQIMIIPSKDFEKAKKIEPPREKADPIPGFYRALFDSWKIFVSRDNATALVFVAAIVGFKFFTYGSCCLAFLTYYGGWGLLFGFYLNIIYETAYEIDKLPEVYVGDSFTFIWYIIKPLLIFVFTMFIAQLPLIIALIILKNRISFGEMWQGHSGYYLLLQVLFVAGLFLFPMWILTMAVGQDMTLLRPDYMIEAICKEFVPYIITVILLVITAILEMNAPVFSAGDSPARIGAGFVLNLGVQVAAIIAMRSIGLFYRHYNCYMKW